MTISRGKQFEQVVRKAFEDVPNTAVLRLHDQMTGYKITSQNPCDFIVFHSPYLYAIECKSVHGNLLPFSNITNNQWTRLEELSKIDKVIAGVICWWVDEDITKFFPIDYLISKRGVGDKSIRYDDNTVTLSSDLGEIKPTIINGYKRRVFFKYDMEKFFKGVEKCHGDMR